VDFSLFLSVSDLVRDPPVHSQSSTHLHPSFPFWTSTRLKSVWLKVTFRRTKILRRFSSCVSFLRKAVFRYTRSGFILVTRRAFVLSSCELFGKLLELLKCCLIQLGWLPIHQRDPTTL
jgi:hypothetical protein